MPGVAVPLSPSPSDPVSLPQLLGKSPKGNEGFSHKELSLRQGDVLQETNL